MHSGFAFTCFAKDESDVMTTTVAYAAVVEQDDQDDYCHKRLLKRAQIKIQIVPILITIRD